MYNLINFWANFWIYKYITNLVCPAAILEIAILSPENRQHCLNPDMLYVNWYKCGHHLWLWRIYTVTDEVSQKCYAECNDAKCSNYPSSIGSSLKEWVCSTRSILSPLEETFGSSLVCRKAKGKYQKLSISEKMVENVSHVFIPL